MLLFIILNHNQILNKIKGNLLHVLSKQQKLQQKLVVDPILKSTSVVKSVFSFDLKW